MENLDVDAVLREAKQEGYATYVLPGAGIVSRETFFEAVREVLPLDPPILSSRSWDALSDSLWGGLESLSAERIAILWPNSATMRRIATSDYDLVTKILADLAESLADSKATNGNPKEISILLG